VAFVLVWSYSCHCGPDVTFSLSVCRKALFLSRLSRREEAIESALLSIAAYPWNWSTWSLLGSCIGDVDEVGALW
jgi:hypothetical protein